MAEAAENMNESSEQANEQVNDQGSEQSNDQANDKANDQGNSQSQETNSTLNGNDSENNVIWPETWRAQIAGEDEKQLERLGRFTDPGALAKSYFEMEKKLSSTPLKTEFPADGSEDEQAAWRESNGVPKEPAGYFENLPEGVEVSDDDRAGIERLAEKMHGANASPAQVHAAMGTFYEIMDDMKAERAEQDIKAQKDTEDALNQLWGGEYRRNINDLNAWLGAGGDEIKTAVLASRLPDGTPLGSNPDFIKWMVGQMREINPIVTVPGLGGGDPAAALDAEIASIENTMRTDRPAYNADKKMQARYLELLDARDKHKGVQS